MPVLPRAALSLVPLMLLVLAGTAGGGRSAPRPDRTADTGRSESRPDPAPGAGRRSEPRPDPAPARPGATPRERLPRDAPLAVSPALPGFGRVAAFGATWAACGWLPVLWPALGWHAYYTLLGALGAWLILAAALVERRALAVGAIVVLVVLRAAQASTPSLDWGSEWYQNRAAAFLRFMRADLLRRRPALAPHARLFFTEVPSNVGFLTEGGPALRVWYGDTTLSGAFLSQYAARAAGGPRGPDLFFRYDSTAGWVELTPGPEDVAAARQRDSRWGADHRDLAAAFARARAWRDAAAEFAKLARAEAEPLEAATNAGVCFAMAGDSSAAARWFDLAARRPGADDEVKRFAREFARHLSSGP